MAAAAAARCFLLLVLMLHRSASSSCRAECCATALDSHTSLWHGATKVDVARMPLKHDDAEDQLLKQLRAAEVRAAAANAEVAGIRAQLNKLRRLESDEGAAVVQVASRGAIAPADTGLWGCHGLGQTGPVPDHPCIPMPSPSQARYQQTDFVALIHFNMATFVRSGDPGCDKSNWNVNASYAEGKSSDPATFNPKRLNTTQWFDSIVGLGANIAVLTAKHGCGFALWPTKTKLPDGSPYGYNVGAPNTPRVGLTGDVLRDFVQSAKAAGVAYGFYFSMMKSFYLCHGITGENSCTEEVLPGQHNYSEAEFQSVQAQMAKELWTEYGNFTELWSDSPLGTLEPMMRELQPAAVNTPYNPVGWCGTENGHPSEAPGAGPYGGDVWSTGQTSWGRPNASEWLPKSCDPTLLHHWFWQKGDAGNSTARSLAEMINIYHDVVGRGMVMELAFSIDRDGLVQEEHAAIYKGLGDWVRMCYGTPLATTAGHGNVFTLRLAEGSTFDRFQLQEETVMGQRVRQFLVSSSCDGQNWVKLVGGAAIGVKSIKLLNRSVTVVCPQMLLRLHIGQTLGGSIPIIKAFSVFEPCHSNVTGARPLKADDAQALVQASPPPPPPCWGGGATWRPLPPSPETLCLCGQPSGVFANSTIDPSGKTWVIQMGSMSIGLDVCIDGVHCALSCGAPPTGPPPPPPTVLQLGAGIQTQDCRENPAFCGFNQAEISLCDGALLMSDRQIYTPPANSSLPPPGYPFKVLPTLHFNGLRILNASLEELGQLGLRHAETVVLTGVGHGGTAAVLHADRIHAALKAIAPNLVKFKLVASDSYHPRHRTDEFITINDNIDKSNIYDTILRGLANVSNAAAGMAPGCRAKLGPAEEWRCLYVNETMPYVKTPTFLVQQLASFWDCGCNLDGMILGLDQGRNAMLQLKCRKSMLWEICFQYTRRCNPQQIELAIAPFQRQYVREMAPFISQPGNGGFLHSCHLGGMWETAAQRWSDNQYKPPQPFQPKRPAGWPAGYNMTSYWNMISIGNVSMSQSVSNWWNQPQEPVMIGATDGNSSLMSLNSHIDCIWPNSSWYPYCNPTCNGFGYY